MKYDKNAVRECKGKAKTAKIQDRDEAKTFRIRDWDKIKNFYASRPKRDWDLKKILKTCLDADRDQDRFS